MAPSAPFIAVIAMSGIAKIPTHSITAVCRVLGYVWHSLLPVRRSEKRLPTLAPPSSSKWTEALQVANLPT
jgi:hypothetical protein